MVSKGKAAIVGWIDPNFNPGAFEITYERINMLACSGFQVIPINIFNRSIDIRKYLFYNIDNVEDVLPRVKGIETILKGNFDIYFFVGITKELMLNKIFGVIKKRGRIVLDLPAEDIQLAKGYLYQIKKFAVRTSDIVLVHSLALRSHISTWSKNVYFLSYNISFPRNLKPPHISLSKNAIAFIYLGRGDKIIEKLIIDILDQGYNVILIGTNIRLPAGFNNKLTIQQQMDTLTIFSYLNYGNYISAIHYDKTFMDQPQKLLRFIYCGVPFVTNRFLGIKKFLNGKCCLFADSYEEYKRLIIELFNNQNLRNALKINSKEFAVNNIDTCTISKKFLKIIENY